MEVKETYLLAAVACTLISVFMESDGPLEVLDYGLLGAATVLLLLSVTGTEGGRTS